MSDNGSGPEFRPHGLIVIQVDEADHWSARLLDFERTRSKGLAGKLLAWRTRQI